MRYLSKFRLKALSAFAVFPLVALVLVLALPKPAHAGFSDCPPVSTVGHTLALNLTDGECFIAELGLGPNSDGSEDYVLIQMANSAGSTNFQLADGGADARSVSYVVNGVTINNGNPNYTTNCSAGCSASGTHGGTPFSFTYTDTGLSGDTGATVGPPSAFTSPSGGGQSATISTAFASVLTATVVDAGSNPVSGVSVTFTAPGSGASGTFSGGGVSETVTTNGSGVATSTTFTANTVAGGYNVVASSAGISNQSFALTNTSGAAATLAVSSGDSQSTAISTSFGTALVALVTDAGGNPVSGVTVNFAAPGSGASAALSAGSDVTDGSGLASVTATANTVAGGYNVTASATGLTSVTFGLTNTSGAAATLAVSSGDSQSTAISTSFGTALVALVTDAGGNPVSGVTVNFAAPGSGASAALSAGSDVTDASGLASVTATANTVAGGYNVTASATGLTSVTFGLTNTSGAAATLAVSSGDSQSAAISTSFGTALVALVTDAGGKPVSGVTVNFAAPGSGASAALSAGSDVTDGSGLASVTATANTVAGAYNVTASATGLTSVTFGLTNLDVVAPTVTLSTSAVSVRPGEDFDVTATFSEAVTGFALLDVLVTHGSAVALSGSGSVYVITIRPTGSGDIGVSIAAGGAQDSSGNGNIASGAIAVQSSAVEETSQLIGQFMNTRATQLISNQPDLTGFLSGSGAGLGQGQGQFNLAVTRGQGTFDISTRPGSRVWTRLQGAISREGTSDSSYVFGAVGSHFAINKNLLLGAMLQLDYLDQDDGAASIKGKGWLIGPYFVTKFPDRDVFVEGRILYGQSSNDVSPFGTYTDKVETERFLALLKLSGSMLYGKTTLIPKVQLTYATDDQKAYRDSLGNLIPDLDVAWGQVELGLDFETPLEVRRGNGEVLLFGGISAIGSHVKNSGNAVTTSSNVQGGARAGQAGAELSFCGSGRVPGRDLL
jgi:hypothetical protein